MKSKFILAGVAAAATASVLSMTAPAALADPGAPGRTYTAVGSDTIQDVWNALSNGTSGINSGAPVIVDGSNNADVASYDATPQNTNIAPKTTTYLRPTGSGNGVKALSASWDSSNHNWLKWDSATNSTVTQTLVNGDVDFARSSSGPSVAGSDLTYIPFARDAVSVAFTKANATDPTPNFTTNELEAIYGGPSFATDPAVSWDNNTTPTKVFVNFGAGAIEVHPYLPQSGSGTRQFFLGALGISNTATFPSYVNTQETYIENDGARISGTTDALIPFSAAQWIAQKSGAATNTTTATEDLSTLNSTDPLDRSGATPLPGALYGNKNVAGLYTQLTTSGVGVFARDTYDVIPSAHYTGGASVDTTLVSHLTIDLNTANARAVITKFGFGNLATRTVKLSGYVH